MLRSAVLLVAILATTPGLAGANPAAGDPRLERLFASFIAPCCWRENLLVHHSPTADRLRDDIRRLVAEGRTDAQIKQELIEQHTIRILSMPEGSRGQWLSWTPLVFVIAGFLVVSLAIGRMRRPVPLPAAGDLPALPDSEWDE